MFDVLIKELVESINTATYEGTTLSFQDVFSNQDDPVVFEFDVRPYTVGGTVLVALDGMLMIPDVGLILGRICPGARDG